MRKFPKRVKLPSILNNRLIEATNNIRDSATPKEEADRIYMNARGSVWFKPIVKALKKISGLGERCMFCSGSESSDVEHYRPKKDFPLLAMTWDNYLWTCTPCNRAKSTQFPIANDNTAILINPMEEDVWKYFYIDEFGNLTPLWDVGRGDFNFRGKETATIIGLDRQVLQESRRSRMNDLKEKAQDALILIRSGRLTVRAAKSRILKWRKQPFQPDVADYFLNGPGRCEQPFKSLFDML